MAAPDEVKRGLEHCTGSNMDCVGCPYRGISEYAPCWIVMERDALECIAGLEKANAEIEDKLSKLLYCVTGGRFSKTTYTADEMQRFAEDYQQDQCGRCEEVGEAQADMTDEAKRLVKALRNSYDYSSRRDDDAADMIEKLSVERGRYWAFIEDMGCESCSGDCDKCVDGSAWTWSGVELSQNADS